MKKIAAMGFVLAMLLAFAGCSAKQKVSNQEITDYLNDAYYTERGMEITELKDIVEYAGEAKNKISLTCTATAHNQYAEQISNWELSFEKFNDKWVGTDYCLGVTTTEIYELPKDEFARIVAPLYYNYICFDILDYRVDTANGTAVADCMVYHDYPAFYTQREEEISLTWNRSELNWRGYFATLSNPITDEELGGIKVDLSTHYEEDSASCFETFDVVRTSDDFNSYALENYECKIKNLWYIETLHLKDANNNDINFKYDNSSDWPYCVFNFEAGSKGWFYIKGDELIYYSPAHTSPIVLSENLQAPIPIQPDFWGTASQS